MNTIKYCTTKFNTKSIKQIFNGYWELYATQNNINPKGFSSKYYKDFKIGFKKGFIKACTTRKPEKLVKTRKSAKTRKLVKTRKSVKTSI